MLMKMFTLCYAMPCCVVLCCVVLCNAMLCHALFWWIPSTDLPMQGRPATYLFCKILSIYLFISLPI